MSDELRLTIFAILMIVAIIIFVLVVLRIRNRTREDVEREAQERIARECPHNGGWNYEYRRDYEDPVAATCKLCGESIKGDPVLAGHPPSR